MAGIPGRPKIWAQVAFNADPNDGGAVPLWTNLTAFLRKIGQNRRGRMYELAQSITAQAILTWRDVNEYLNPANTSSPYNPNVQPLRQVLLQGMWPNPENDSGLGSAVNLINSRRWKGNNETAPDPSFESYANGAALPGWLTAIGSVTGTVTTTNPQQGTKSLTYPVAGTAVRQGVSWIADCVPGEQYTTSVYVRQSTGSTQRLMVGDQILAYDEFGRSASNGWGTADFGGSWSTASGSASDFSVSSGAGKQAINTLAVRRFTYLGTSLVDTSTVMTVTCPVLITGSASNDFVGCGPVARYIDVDNHYRVELVLQTDGYITADIQKRVAGVSTGIGTLVTPFGYLYYPGQPLKIRFECINSTLRMRVWLASQSEPTTWNLTATDTALSAPGAIGCQTAASSGVTNTLPVTISFDSLFCSGADSSTSTTTSGSYVRLTRTFTATAPRHTMTVCTSGTATAGDVNIDAAQHEPGAAASTFTTSGPVIFPIMRPYVERWPRNWSSAGFEGIATTPTVDSFAALNNIRIWPDYYYAVLATGPQYFWPMASGTNSSALPDISGNDGVPLSAVVSTFGAGTAPSFGSAVTMAGDAGANGVGFVPDQSTLNFQAATVVGAGRVINGMRGFNFPGFLSTIPPGSAISVWAITATCWFKLTTKSPSNYTYLMAIIDQSTYQEIFSLGLDSSGEPFAFTKGPTGSSLTAVPTSASYLDGKLHNLTCTLNQVNGGDTTLEVFIDGVSVTSAFVSTATIGVYTRDADTISIGGLANGANMYAVANGTVLFAALWKRALSSTEIATLYSVGATGNNNELTGTRLARHLASGPFVGATRISAGLTTLQPPSWTGSIDLLSDGQQLAVAEGGVLWTAPDGAVVLEGRRDRWLRLTPAAVFGEDVAGGEIPYLEDITFDYDPIFVYGDVQVTRSNGGTFFGGLSADVSIAVRKFFGRPYRETSDYATNAQAQDKADYTFYTHRAPIQRVSVITVDPSSNPTIWPTIAVLEVGQRVTVKRRAKAANAGAGITMSADYFIETVINPATELDMDKGVWKVAYILSPIGLASAAPNVSFQSWILEDTTYGVLDSTTVLGW